MAALTEIVSLPQAKKAPLLLEVPLPPGLDGPFLVSSSKGVIWISNKFPNGMVRAAVRKIPLDFLFREMLLSFSDEAEKAGWGNALPATREGIEQAILHLKEYEIDAVEILWGEGFDESLLPSTIPSTETSWIPAGWAIVVAADRSFVGTSFEFGNGQWASVLHNPSRGLAVLKPAGSTEGVEGNTPSGD